MRGRERGGPERFWPGLLASSALDLGWPLKWGIGCPGFFFCFFCVEKNVHVSSIFGIFVVELSNFLLNFIRCCLFNWVCWFLSWKLIGGLQLVHFVQLHRLVFISMGLKAENDWLGRRIEPSAILTRFQFQFWKMSFDFSWNFFWNVSSRGIFHAESIS